MSHEYAVNIENIGHPSVNIFVPGGEEGAERKKGYSEGSGSSWGGARPGAGRKPKVNVVQDDPCLQEVEKFISHNLMDIVAAMVERAKKGDNVAAKYLIDRKLGRPAKLTIDDFIECQEYLEEAIDEITDEINEDESIEETDPETLITENQLMQTHNTKLAQAEFLRRMRANNRRRKMARRK